MRYWDEFWPLVLSIGFLAGVVGNLVASLLWGLPAFTHLHRKLNRNHAEQLAQAARHHAERLEQADRHHEAVMATLQSSASSPRSRTDKRLLR
jgi:hypothetical protein